MAGSPTDATSADNETTPEVDFDYVCELLDLYRTTIESIQGTPKYRRAPLLTEARKTVYAIAQALGIPTLAQVHKDEQAAVVARAAAAAGSSAGALCRLSAPWLVLRRQDGDETAERGCGVYGRHWLLYAGQCETA